MQRPWEREYAKSAWWKKTWQQVTLGGAEWPEGYQLRGDGNQFLYASGKICVPESLANEILKQWHAGKLGHAGKAKCARWSVRGS